MDDLLTEFLTETVESLDNLDVEIVQLEQNPNDPELLGNIFRLVHTIKGTCGFIGLTRLESVAHAGENVLGNFREGIQEVTPEAVSLILAALDRIKEIVAVLEETEAEPAGDDKELIAQLDAMYRAGKEGTAPTAAEPADAASADAESSAAEPAVVAEAPQGSLYERAGATSAIDAAIELMYSKVMADEELAPLFEGVEMARMQGHTVEYIIKAFGGPDDYFNDALKPFFEQLSNNGFSGPHFNKVGDHFASALALLEIDPAVIDDAMMVFMASEAEFVLASGEDALQSDAADAEQIADAVEAEAEEDKPEEVKAEASQPKETSVANQSIRVNVELLEALMTTVSELVLTRNQLLQMVRHHEDSEFKVPLQRLSHVTTDLQEGVMKTRMQPIGNAWNKLPRIIRDLGNDLGKKIELKMLGADTELDRQVLEMIKDPLTHMVRNSGDHGLEGPEDRVKAGKPETGTVTLNAYHEGGHIIIEIADDGRGINIGKVKEKIVANGLATEAELEGYSDQQIQQFIFKAGFSTAEKVTNVSGRGVGMDVVRTNIEKIGGQIELRSEEGKGSTFIIKIPLTLAIVSALIVRCGTEKFAIPQLSVVELVRVSSASDHRIEKVNETPVLRLRDRLLPLVSLPNLLKLGDDDLLNAIDDPETGSDDEEAVKGPATATVSSITGEDSDDSFIVVAQVGPYTFGLVVDAVFDTEEIVVKPVAPILRDISVYSGNTILGDGSVIMILDPNGIATATGSISATNPAEEADAAVSRTARDERTALLVFRAGTSEPKAVPLALVARLEEIEAEAIEISNGQPVVQYRGQLMPLLAVSDGFERATEGRQPVLVFTDRDRSMGLMVDEILDIVEESLNIEISAEIDGVIGSAIVDGHATEIIDASSFLTRAYSDWFGRTDAGAEIGHITGRILLIDDSPFFRNLMAPLLRVAGYEVLTAESADDALLMRDSGEAFDVIVSDIEMPGMDGFDLARALKENGAWSKTPIVALSSRTSAADIEAGREAGFVDYVPKQDREALLETLSSTIVKMKGAA